MNPDLTKEKVLSNLQDFGYKVPNGSQAGGAFTRTGIISQDGTTPITPSSLTPEKPLVTPTLAPANTTIDTTGEAAVTAAQTANEAKANALKTANETEKNSIMDLVSGVADQESKKISQYDEQGLITQKAELDKIKLEMSQANQRAQKQIDTILSQNPTGMGGAGAQGEINRIQRENAAYQADRAFGLAALQGNYTAAKDAIDAKIDAETSGMKLQLEAKKYFYEQNREDFTTAEKRAYEAMLLKDERNYKETISAKQILGETQITALKNAQEQGAPQEILQVIQKATTPEGVIIAAGSYGTDLKRRMEIAKLQKEASANGFNIDVTKLSPEAQGLLKSVTNLRFKNTDEANRIIGNISNSLKQGDLEGAQSELKAFGYEKLPPAQQQDYVLYDNALSSADSALTQISDQNLSAGPYKSLAESKKPFVGITRDKAFVDLKAVIELGQAQLRKAFYGTAVTGTETLNARNFLIGDNDDIKTIQWKLQNNKDYLRFVNDATISRAVGLPKPSLDDYLTYRVKDKASGQTGLIPRSEYDAKTYDILNK